jgi:preprotein translocase subunit SecB|tara:strand:+ start:314 stop:733 length:420 start_codon:yes stop_codon:yes gene_type:complete
MNYKIVGKYIKDLKFEIPNPKTFFLLEKSISNYKINIDIKSHNFKDKIVEVVITLSLNPIKNDGEKIITKISFATIVEINDVLEDKTLLEEIILIKIPSEVYPEIRLLFILLFEKSGFNKIKIEEKINFKELHQKRTIQ